MLLSKASESSYSIIKETNVPEKKYYFMSCQILLTIAAVFTPFHLTNSNESY